MKDVTLVFVSGDHPLVPRLNRLKKKGMRFLHRNADEWEGNVSPCKAVALESRDWPTFEKLVGHDKKDKPVFETITLADEYEKAGIPVRILKRQKPESVDIEPVVETPVVETRPIVIPPTAEGRKAKRDQKKKSVKNRL